MRKTNPISATGGRCRAGTPNLRRAETCKTNPISPRRKRLTEGIVQNEAKLGETGVCGQRPLSCGAWLGRRVKCAVRTQFLDCGLQIADWETAVVGGRRRQNVQNKMPTTKVPKSGFGRRFGADIKGRFG
jgi:hypothetical protein